MVIFGYSAKSWAVSLHVHALTLLVGFVETVDDASERGRPAIRTSIYAGPFRLTYARALEG